MMAYQPGTHGGADESERYQVRRSENHNGPTVKVSWVVVDTRFRSNVFSHSSETAARRHAHKRNASAA